MAVRRESVILSLESDIPEKALESAAALGLLDEAINRLSKRSASNRSATKAMGDDLTDVERTAKRSGAEIDKLSGRMRIWGDVIATIGPGLIPIGAVGIPAIAGLASSMGFAALAGGTMIGAFQGVGDALGALNKAHLEPTQANLDAAKLAMEQISPAARDFTRELSSLEPALKGLRDTAAANMFPGLTEGLDQMQGALPAIQRIVAAVSGELGSLGADGGKSLAGPRWASFFKFLADEAPQALADMARGTGNVAHAMAELWMDFSPLNSSFSSFLVDSTAKFDRWASTLSKTDGFHEFIAYIQKSGPEVGHALAAIADAVIQIVEAAAPLGGPVLHAITAMANALAGVADSDLGTPIFTALAALALYNRVLGKTGFLQTSTFGAKAKGQLTGYSSALLGVTSAEERALTPAGQMAKTMKERNAAMAKGAAAAALLAVSTSGLADKFSLANTANLALMGGMVGGAPGAGVGAAVGLFLDLSHASDSAAQSIQRVTAAAATGDWSSMDKGISNVNKQLKDMQHVTGVKDFFSDGFKSLGAALPGGTFGVHGLTGVNLTDKSKKKLDAAEDAKDQASLAAATRAQGAALQAAASGYQLTAAGAAAAAGGIRAFTAAATAANAAISKQGDYDAYRQAVLDAADAIKRNGRALKANGDIMKGHARAGLEERAALRNVASGFVTAAAGMKDFDRKSKFINRARADFLNLAHDTGMSAGAARAMAKAMGLIPLTRKSKVTLTGPEQAKARIASMRAEIARLRDKSVHMDEKGAAAARARIAALKAAIAALRGKSVDIVTHYKSTGRPGQAGNHARGGLYGPQRFAGGGFGDVADRHMPELAGPGLARIWREPETQGEAYIPLANDDRRPRARGIAAETVGMLGGDPDSIEWYAGGGHHKGHKKKPTKSNNLQHAIDKLTAAVETETSARDDLVSKRNDLASTVGGNFLSDPFGSSNVWSGGGGAGGVLGILQGDTAKAKQFQKILAALRKNGVSGQALAAIASTGDVGQAQGLLALGASGDKKYQSAFDQRTAATNAVGMYAGNSVYGGGIAVLQRELAQTRAELKKLNAEQKKHHAGSKARGKEHADHVAAGVGKHLNGAAGHAKRNRNRHSK